MTNVHGVRENFLIIGDQRKEAAARGEPFVEGDRCAWQDRAGVHACVHVLSGFFLVELMNPSSVTFGSCVSFSCVV